MSPDDERSDEERRIARYLQLGLILLFAGGVAARLAHQAWGAWWPYGLYALEAGAIVLVMARGAARSRGLRFREVLLHPGRGQEPKE